MIVPVDLDTLFDHSMTLPDPAEPLDKVSLPSGGGVYALVDENGSVLQTIGTQSLRRSIYHRLCPPATDRPSRRADLRAIARELRWQPTYSVFETDHTYLTLARRLRPGRYRKELAFGPVWFARIQPADRFPRWQIDSTLTAAPGVNVGPFFERRRCAAFVELLEDLFDLCRKHEILQQAPQGTPCLYHEMGKCPAPCNGSIPLTEYASMLRQSIEFAVGGDDSPLRTLKKQMKAAAANQEFERAGRIKDRMDRVAGVLKNDGRVCRTPDAFRYLIVQRGGGTSRIKPFFVHRGAIQVGEVARFKELDAVVPEWINRTASAVAEETPADTVYRSECIWLVSHFLLKGDKAPGLFLPATELTDAKAVAQRIRARFGRSDRASENMRDTGSIEAKVDSPR